MTSPEIARPLTPLLSSASVPLVSGVGAGVAVSLPFARDEYCSFCLVWDWVHTSCDVLLPLLLLAVGHLWRYTSNGRSLVRARDLDSLFLIRSEVPKNDGSLLGEVTLRGREDTVSCWWVPLETLLVYPRTVRGLYVSLAS
jgi:hypothetical protein